jgi:hypothetical protein
MDEKPAPFQFSLRDLFRLTTKAAVIAAVFALLPRWLQADLAKLVGMLLVGVLMMAVEVVAWSLGSRLIQNAWLAAKRAVGAAPPGMRAFPLPRRQRPTPNQGLTSR